MKLRARIVSYYTKHNPSKLECSDFPDRLIAAYRREKRLCDLIREMCVKYGCTEEDEWILLDGTRLDEQKRRSFLTNPPVQDDRDGAAHVEHPRSPHGHATLLPTPTIEVRARGGNEQAGCAVCPFTQQCRC